MSENIVEVLLAVFGQAEAAGPAAAGGMLLYHSRERAYEAGMQDGLVYDATVNGLITSVAGKPTGITDKGREAFAALKSMVEDDTTGFLAQKFASVFLPSKGH